MPLEIIKINEENYKEVAALALENLAEAWSEQIFFEQLSNPNDYCFCAYYDGKIAGFLDVWNVLGEVDINNIAVSEDFRRKGIAFALINEMEKHFSSALSCTLEVRESNQKAILLYRKCGFKEVGRRKNFYTAPTEAAIIMKKIWRDK